MHTFVVLGTYTEQGRRAIHESPKRLDGARAALAKLGGSLTTFYLTMGPYDFVAIIEAPSDELVAKFVLAVAARGRIKTITLKAFPEAEYRRLIAGAHG